MISIDHYLPMTTIDLQSLLIIIIIINAMKALDEPAASIIIEP